MPKLLERARIWLRSFAVQHSGLRDKNTCRTRAGTEVTLEKLREKDRQQRAAQTWQAAAELEAMVRDIQKQQESDAKREERRAEARRSAAGAPPDAAQIAAEIVRLQARIRELLQKSHERLEVVEQTLRQKGAVINPKIVESRAGIRRILAALEERLVQCRVEVLNYQAESAAEVLQRVSADLIVYNNPDTKLLDERPLVLAAGEWESTVEWLLKTVEYELNSTFYKQKRRGPASGS